MAKNWSVSEALQVVTVGKNLEAIRDIGRRFPLFLFFVLHNPLKIIEAFGARVTARTVNKQLEKHLEGSTKVIIHVEKHSNELELGQSKTKEIKEKPKEEKKELKEIKGKEEIKDKKVKEDEVDNLDFDVEDLLEPSKS